MKNKKVKLLALLLTAVVGCTACGQQDNSTGESKESDKEAVELEMVCNYGVTLPDKEDNFVEQTIKEAIGVDVTLNIVGAGADYTTALNARISGGDIPDLFLIPNTSVLTQYVDNNVVLNLNDYLDQLQPYVDYIGGEAALKVNTYNGGVYTIPRLENGSYSTWVVRQDWLDKVGAEAPTTMEEALEVAKKITFEDPDGNGAQDTYGFSGNGLRAFNGILNSYGGATSNIIMVEDGEVTSALLAPNMKQGLEMCKQFVDAGVVDPDIMANNDESTREKMAQGKLGMAAFNWAAMYKQVFMDQLTAVDPNADWVWFAPLESGTGDRACYETISAVSQKGVWCVSAEIAENPDKLDAVVKLLNYIASDEGERLVDYGIEGRHYNIVDGEVQKTDLMSTECDYLWAYQIGHRPESEYLAVKFPEAVEVIQFAANMERIVSYNDAVIAPEGFHKEDMDKYIEENILSFIYGTRDISEYDQFIEELNNSFGFNEFMESAEEQLKERGLV